MLRHGMEDDYGLCVRASRLCDRKNPAESHLGPDRKWVEKTETDPHRERGRNTSKGQRNIFPVIT